MDDIEVSVVTVKIRKRALYMKAISFIYVLFILTLGIYLTTIIIKAPISSVNVNIGNVSIPKTSKIDPKKISVSINIEGNVDARSEDVLAEQVISAIIRIGTIIVPMIVMYYLYTIAKYNLRMASLLHQKADAIELSKGDTDKLLTYDKVLKTDSITFPEYQKPQISLKEISDFEEKSKKLSEIFKRFGIK